MRKRKTGNWEANNSKTAEDGEYSLGVESSSKLYFLRAKFHNYPFRGFSKIVHSTEHPHHDSENRDNDLLYFVNGTIYVKVHITRL